MRVSVEIDEIVNRIVKSVDVLSHSLARFSHFVSTASAFFFSFPSPQQQPLPPSKETRLSADVELKGCEVEALTNYPVAEKS